MMYLIEYREILTQNNQLWVKRFEKRYTKPGDEHKSGGWKARSSWMTVLNGIRNEVNHARGISEEAFAFLIELRDRGCFSARSTMTCSAQPANGLGPYGGELGELVLPQASVSSSTP